jgi:hypothetical protein
VASRLRAAGDRRRAGDERPAGFHRKTSGAFLFLIGLEEGKLTDYRIELVETVVDPAERRRRIGRVYSLLLDIARRKETADRESSGGDTQSAASEARPEAGASPGELRSAGLSRAEGLTARYVGPDAHHDLPGG